MESPPAKTNRAVFGGQFGSSRPSPPPRDPTLPSGRELLERINNGSLQKAPTEYLEAVRRKVVENCEEIIQLGARVRPLLVGETQVGWVRGVHDSERKLLKRWLKDPYEFISHILSLGTAFTTDEIEDLSPAEVSKLMHIIRQMSEYDASLYPYLSAFVSTQVSENLWFAEGVKLTSYENRLLPLPDGRQMRIAVPPDHARIWASLCTYREQAKKRLDENWNALLTVRPMAGKSVNPLQAELKAIARRLQTNSLEPWQTVVKADPKVNVDDGWAHPGDSLEDLQREMMSMIKGDRHERFMEAWTKQIEEREAKRRAALTARRKARSGDKLGVVEEKMEILTDQEMRARQQALKAGKAPPPRSSAPPQYGEPVDARMQKFLRYRNLKP